MMEKVKDSKIDEQTAAKTAQEQAAADAAIDQAAPKTSILQEEYQGPSATVAAVGVGAIESKVMWLVGLIVGGLFGAAAPETVNHWAESSQDFAEKMKVNNPKGSGGVAAIKRGTSKFISKMFEWSEVLAKHLPGHDKIAGKFGTHRSTAVIAAGGITSLAAIIASVVHGAFVGTKSAHGGRDQFNRAKHEIRTLRNEKIALEEELADSTKALTKERARQTAHNTLHHDTPEAEHRQKDAQMGHHSHNNPEDDPQPKLHKPTLEHARLKESHIAQTDHAHSR